MFVIAKKRKVRKERGKNNSLGVKNLPSGKFFLKSKNLYISFLLFFYGYKIKGKEFRTV
jgi:hypothetical protein